MYEILTRKGNLRKTTNTNRFLQPRFTSRYSEISEAPRSRLRRKLIYSRLSQPVRSFEPSLLSWEGFPPKEYMLKDVF